jgi:hypothetical protein
MPLFTPSLLASVLPDQISLTIHTPAAVQLSSHALHHPPNHRPTHPSPLATAYCLA